MARGVVKGGLNDGGKNIKSIQRGILRLDDIGGSETVTISAVDLTKAVVKISFSGMGYTFTDTTRYSLVQAKLTSSTTIVISRGEDSGDMRVWWEVIEFNNVKSLQKGDANALVYNGVYGFDVQEVSISTVDPLKSIIFFSYKTTALGGSSSIIDAFISCEVMANLLRFEVKIDASNEIHWQLVEFN